MIRWFKNFFINWGIAFSEIQNWFYVLKIIRKHKGDADWEQFQLRADWIGRIYTVLNPQLPGDKGDTKEVLKYKYAERLKPINLYIDAIGLGEYVYPAYEELPDSDSYLIVYSPIFNVITVWRAFLFVSFWLFFFLTDYDTKTWNTLTWLFHKIFN